MVSEEMCGQRAALPKSCTEPLESAITVITWDDCCVKRAGADKRQLNGLRNAMMRPSKRGMNSDGQPSKKS